MSRFDPTPSKDGQERLDVVLRGRLTLEELVDQMTVALSTTLPDDVQGDERGTRAWLRSALPSRTAAVNVATREIWTHGVEHASFEVGDQGIEELWDLVAERVAHLWRRPSFVGL